MLHLYIPLHLFIVSQINTGAVTSPADSDRVSSLAEESYEKSLTLCEKLKAQIDGTEYLKMKAGALMNLGLVHDVRNDVAKCAQYFKRALEITE